MGKELGLRNAKIKTLVTKNYSYSGVLSMQIKSISYVIDFTLYLDYLVLQSLEHQNS